MLVCLYSDLEQLKAAKLQTLHEILQNDLFFLIISLHGWEDF